MAEIVFLIPARDVDSLHRTLSMLSFQKDHAFRAVLVDLAGSEAVRSVAADFEHQFPVSVETVDPAGQPLWKCCLDAAPAAEWVCFLVPGVDLNATSVQRMKRCIDKHPDYDVFRWNLTAPNRKWRLKTRPDRLFTRVFVDKDEAPLSSFVFRGKALREVLRDDSDAAGKKLRLYQQYFLASCAAQLILLDMKSRKCDLRKMYDYAVIQINESHPALLIPELIRVLTDDKALSFMEAVDVVTRSCAYTNHTIMAEALDTWSLDELTEAAPQLVPIIHRLDLIVKSRYQDPSVLIIDSGRRVRMAYLCVHFCFSVNGVSKSHTGILENSRLKGFYRIYPERFSNKTNGISFRRWLLGCNPDLADLICDKIGNAFKLDSSQLEKLSEFAEDERVIWELDRIKLKAKKKLAAFVKKEEGIELLPDGIYDLQVKRIHEYKRQQLAALYVIREYLRVKRGERPARPVNFIFGGKAAPGYTMAQDILHLMLVLQEIVNGDPEVNPYLRMAVVTNYNVTYAERLIPAAEISEQISLASRESSGTGNMKLMLNGALTLGTRDGANVEIGELTDGQSVYYFGISPEEAIERFDTDKYDPAVYYENSPEIREAVDFIAGPQVMAVGQRERLQRLWDELRYRDRYMTLLDFGSYAEVKDRMLLDYEDRSSWNRKVLKGISCAGYFSADRAVAEYNRDIWKLKSFQTYSEEGK